MLIFQIVVEGNTGSTGTMAEHIGALAISKGHRSVISYARFPRKSTSELIKIGNKFDIILHGLETRLLDRHCLASRKATKELVKKISELRPDIIHIHHIHGYYINMVILFNYLAIAKIPIVWTFHDCWAFTGHCAHFDYIGCNKWKIECNSCPQIREYPASWFVDRSQKNYHLKKDLFSNLNNLIIVTPSNWLLNLTKQSFFYNSSMRTIHNGVDLNVFKFANDFSDLQLQYKSNNEFVILGVAFPWTERKGLNEFLKLSRIINEKVKIILVGLNQFQINSLPSNIIGLTKTESREELVKLYSFADVYINPTLEDNFPTTNLEALACGTPVITYSTGGSPEAITSDTGIVVEKMSINGLLAAIEEIRRNGKIFYTKSCRKRAEDFFSKEKQFMKYLDLYSEILNKNEVQ